MLQFRLTYLIWCIFVLFNYLPRLDTTVIRSACISTKGTDTQTLAQVQLMAKSHNSTYLSLFLYLRIVKWIKPFLVGGHHEQSPVILRLMFLILYLNIHISYRSQLPSYVLYFFVFYLNWSKKYICRYFDWNEIKRMLLDIEASSFSITWPSLSSLHMSDRLSC